MRELVYPWDDSNFKGLAWVKSKIYDDLYKYIQDSHRYQKFMPNKNIISLCKKVFNILYELQANTENIKWLVISSDSFYLIKHCANIIPIVYALTEKKYSIKMSNFDLLPLFKLTNTEEVSLLNRIKNYSMFVWDNFLVSPRGMNYYSGNIMDMLTQRIDNEKITMITSPFVGSDQEFFMQITEIWGKQVFSLLRENSIFRFF